MSDKLKSPLILKYQKDYENNPKSRVFVPLAESYRKVGLIEKAIDILRKGLEHHPHYVTAHVVLGNCYIDLKQYEKALRVLSPVAEEGSENLKLLRLLAITYREMNELENAKKYYKYLLFFNPKDEESADQLKKLEDRMPEEALKEELPKVKSNQFDANIEKEVYQEADEWMRVDLKEDVQAKKTETESSVEGWKVESINSIRNQMKEDLPKEISVDLVNVYQSQGLYQRALEILDAYLKRDPDNQIFIEKQKNLKLLLDKKTNKIKVQTLEDLPDEGSASQKQETDSPKRVSMRKQRLESLLSGIKKKAQEHQSSHSN